MKIPKWLKALIKVLKPKQKDNTIDNTVVIEEPKQDKTMKLVSKRFVFADKYTVSKLYIDDVFFCYILEDADRGLDSSMSLDEISKLKVKTETAIPYGTYKVNMNTVSPKYSNFTKYKWAEQYEGKIPRLMNVPGYEGILIHVGNYAKDTDGCLLPGDWSESNPSMVSGSTAKFHSLMAKLLSAEDEITIEITK